MAWRKATRAALVAAIHLYRLHRFWPGSARCQCNPGGPSCSERGLELARQGATWAMVRKSFGAATVAVAIVMVLGMGFVPAHHHGGGGGCNGAPAQASIPNTGGYGSPSARETACIVRVESGGDPTAYNQGSQAGGLYQFLPSTWALTPQGPSYPDGAQTAPASVQTAAYDWAYEEWGDHPWCPYDGCCDGNPD